MSRRPIRVSKSAEGVSLEQALGAPETVDPRLAVPLRAHSVATLAELRKTRGSRDGNMGPRALMLAGFEDPLDGGEGVFGWDDTSTAVDDEGIQVVEAFGVPVGRWHRMQIYPDLNMQLLRAPQVVTAGTTYAPSVPGCSALVELVAGGGGSGGVVNSAAAQTTIATGGASGGNARKFFASLPASCTIAIGAAGTAGANTGTDGGAGGDTTFSDGVTTVTTKGGNGGQGSTATGGSGAAARLFGGALPGTVSTNGDVNGCGQAGDMALQIAAQTAISGSGGASVFGAGGNPRTTTGAGVAGVAPGAGASGALSFNAGGAQAGAAGKAGILIVWEFA